MTMAMTLALMAGCCEGHKSGFIFNCTVEKILIIFLEKKRKEIYMHQKPINTVINHHALPFSLEGVLMMGRK